MNIFNGYESEIHKNAKHKLFNLIVNHKINIYDNNNIYYNIFPYKYKNEFLHLESFNIGYHSNNPIYSNDYLPCNNIFNIKISPCSFRGGFGVIENLPCNNCLKNSKLKNDYKNIDINKIGFRPDIAWGYENEYKVWLEVNYAHSCNDNKILYCANNNIILLEFDAEEINNLSNDYIIGHDMIHKHMKKFIINYEDLFNNLLGILNNNLYYEANKFKEDLGFKAGNYKYRYLLNKYEINEISAGKAFKHRKFNTIFKNINNKQIHYLIKTKDLEKIPKKLREDICVYI